MVKIKRLIKYVGVTGENKEPVNEFKRYMQEFDEHQNCVKEVEFNPAGEIESASKYTYNDQHKMIEEIHYFNEEEIGEHIKYRFNEKGEKLEIETLYSDGAKSIKKINRSGLEISANIVDEEGEKEGEERVRFNDKGQPLEEVHFDEDKNVMQRSVFQYDDDGNAVGRINYGENDEFQLKTLFEYDEKRHLKKLIQLSEKGDLIASYTYDYNSDGKQVLQQSNQHSIHTEYDGEGRIAAEETRSRANNMVEKMIEYKYGEHGLVVEERMFSMGDAYQLQPAVFSRTASSFNVTRYEYEFY